MADVPKTEWGVESKLDDGKIVMIYPWCLIYDEWIPSTDHNDPPHQHCTKKDHPYAHTKDM